MLSYSYIALWGMLEGLFDRDGLATILIAVLIVGIVMLLAGLGKVRALRAPSFHAIVMPLLLALLFAAPLFSRRYGFKEASDRLKRLNLLNISAHEDSGGITALVEEQPGATLRHLAVTESTHFAVITLRGVSRKWILRIPRAEIEPTGVYSQ